VARIPASYKSSLSAALPSSGVGAKHKEMSPSPKKEKFI
jgi:hypothetical protein